MLSELSLNVLDIAQNSVRAKAKLIEIFVDINIKADLLTIIIKDDGHGMTAEQLNRIKAGKFYTTRLTRKIGFGINFFKMAAEFTGGSFEIFSEENNGTFVKAIFILSSLDRKPLGDINKTIEILIIYNKNIDFIYSYKVDNLNFILSTAEMKTELGSIPLDNPEVVNFIREFLEENTSEINNGRVF